MNINLPIKYVDVTRINGDIELNKIKTEIITNNRKKESQSYVYRRTLLKQGDKDSYKNNEFTPTVPFPISSTDIYPGIVNHIGSPEKFYLGSLVLNAVNETQFSRRLILSLEVAYKVFDNYDEKIFF